MSMYPEQTLAWPRVLLPRASSALRRMAMSPALSELCSAFAGRPEDPCSFSHRPGHCSSLKRASDNYERVFIKCIKKKKEKKEKQRGGSRRFKRSERELAEFIYAALTVVQARPSVDLKTQWKIKWE